MSKIKISLDNIKHEVFDHYRINQKKSFKDLTKTPRNVIIRLALIRLSFIFSKYNFNEICEYYNVNKSFSSQYISKMQELIKNDDHFISDNNIIEKNIINKYGANFKR